MPCERCTVSRSQRASAQRHSDAHLHLLSSNAISYAQSPALAFQYPVFIIQFHGPPIVASGRISPEVFRALYHYNTPLVCSLAADLKTGVTLKSQISTETQPLCSQI
ncbi:hypothetical protein N656DRAFT_374711 [Canariomyces notabilis]|uniref:Uncharacterized protein n=1 Tax=Canariomyces notabilis TaxID=2074819 RepID=A0AAN6T9H2_9PEZI|nr:hypothetical protein N656DRAFT_374711 [Canariomyces arenarius]